MLNEKRVKHMVKLASYETKGGEEEFNISSYFKGDYISFHVLCTLLWTTVGFIAMVALAGIAYMDVILEDLTFEKGIYWLSGLAAAYLVLQIVYGIIAYRYYKKKHLGARSRMKRLGQGLEQLEKLYESEQNSNRG